jgi:hypothetical protein
MKKSRKEWSRDRKQEREAGENSQEREARNVARRKKPFERSLGKAVRIAQPGESSRKREARKEQLGEKPGEGSKKNKTKRNLQCKHMLFRQTRQDRDSGTPVKRRTQKDRHVVEIIYEKDASRREHAKKIVKTGQACCRGQLREWSQ